MTFDPINNLRRDGLSSSVEVNYIGTGLPRWEVFETFDPSSEDGWSDSRSLFMKRLKVHGGWLVSPVGYSPVGYLNGGGMAFVVDTGHLWRVDAEESR